MNNTTSYFLRLPDGSLDGGGLPACDFQSMGKLRSGEITGITSIDNSTTYHNWSVLTTTIESIINTEIEGINNKWIHYLDPDLAVNPGDHPDHGATGHAIQGLLVLRNFHQSIYMGYCMSSSKDHLPVSDMFWKAGMLAVYEKAVYDYCGYSTLKENPDLYLRWCSCKPKFLTVFPAS